MTCLKSKILAISKTGVSNIRHFPWVVCGPPTTFRNELISQNNLFVFIQNYEPRKINMGFLKPTRPHFLQTFEFKTPVIKSNLYILKVGRPYSGNLVN